MYQYKNLRPSVFTEEGLVMFTKIRDRSLRLLEESGAFTMWSVIQGATGDSWMMLACVDLMVERGEIHEVTGSDVAGQHRVFVRA